jgi:superkiller protein 3
MSEEHEVIPTSVAPAPSRLDNILNILLGALIGATVLFAAYFGYSVWQVRTAQALANPALRLIEGVKEEVRANPNDSALRVRLGEAYVAAGKYEQAIEQFDNALKLDPEHTGAFLNLGMVAAAQGELAGARGYFDKVVELTEASEFADVNNRREVALYHLGLVALEDKEYEEAVGYLKGALRIRKDASDTYYYLARAYYGLDEPDAAIAQLEAALAFDPNFAQAHFLMGELYMADGDEVNASYHFYRAAELAPDIDITNEALLGLGSAEERIARGENALAEGDIDAAVKEALIARNVAPDNIQAVLFHAKVLVAHDAYPEAMAAYRDALELDEGNDMAISELERLEGLVGDDEEKDDQ